MFKSEIFKKIMALENAINNCEEQAEDCFYYDDYASGAYYAKRAEELRSELASLRKEWAESEETLVYSC